MNNMFRHILISVFVFFLTCLCGFSQDRPQDLLLREIISRYGQAEVEITSPGRSAMDIITRNVSVSSVKGDNVCIMLSPLTVEWFIRQGFVFKIIEMSEGKGVLMASSLEQAMEWESYPSYTQYDSIMRRFLSDYPSLCRLDTIGTSINGRLILALKISDNPSVDENEPEVFYSSSIHGDEIGSYVLMLRLSDYLLKNYGIDSRITDMINNLEIWINPLANPDGTYTTGNIITYPTRANSAGIDLNRNFPDPLVPGIVPQKENVAMIQFLRKHHFVISANFHAGAEVLNYPWDRWYSKFHADTEWFNHICRSYADTVHTYSGPAYMNFLDNGVTRGADWYVIYGGRQDFITWELQGREVTIELDDIKQTPAAQLGLLWQYNYRSLVGYLENAMYGIHGLVTDSESSAPVPARIFISGYDKDSSQVYSEALSGTFTRYLMPGTWSLSLSAKGYRDTVISNVIVNDRQRTDLFIEMEPVISNIDTTEPLNPLLYPLPASGLLYCRLPEKICGRVRITLINQAGLKVRELVIEASFGIPFELDISDLAAGAYTIIFRNQDTGITGRERIITTGRLP